MAGNFPVAQGYPQHSGTAIPTLWSKLWNYKFYLQTSLPYIANTDWEGEIQKFGDQVKIRNIPDGTVGDYYKGKKLTYETLERTTTDLNIDKGHDYAFGEDIIDLNQTDQNYVEKQIEDYANKIKIRVENRIYAAIFSDASSSNQGLTAGYKTGGFNLGVSGTPLSWSSSNSIRIITRIGAVLDEYDIPPTDRYLIIPPIISSLIKDSDIKDASLSGDKTSMARTGILGEIDRFSIFVSNNLTTTTDGGDTVFNIIAGQKSALTFAGQITNSEDFKAESTYGTKYRGLFAYGYKVIKPEALAWVYAKADQS